MKILLLFLIIILQYSLAEIKEVPVLITDDGHALANYKTQSDPFSKMKDFEELVQEVLKTDNPVIIFVEDKLSIEDITSKDELGSPYSYLNNHLQNNVLKYIPAVPQALTILTQSFPPLTSNVFYTYSADKLNLDPKFKYVYVRFVENPNSSNKTRVAKLRDHDLLMNAVYTRARQARSGNPSMITFYTGKMNPVTIEKLNYRYTRTTQNSDEKIVISENALFRLAGVYAVSPLRSRNVRYTHEPTIAAENKHGAAHMSTSVSYSDFELMFNFKFSHSGWILDNVALLEGDEEVGRTLMGVGAPWNHSFVCAEPITLINYRDSSSVTISKYQIQALDSNGDNSTFGSKVNCGPYFNGQILSGLFVVGILLGILFTGVILLMNCHSNDRFDNPQGKEIITKADLGN